jgi:hypothetical protein
VAASALGLWVVSRVAYTSGYASGDPAKVRSSNYLHLQISDYRLKRHNILTQITYMPALASKRLLDFSLDRVGLQDLQPFCLGRSGASIRWLLNRFKIFSPAALVLVTYTDMTV